MNKNRNNVELNYYQLKIIKCILIPKKTLYSKLKKICSCFVLKKFYLIYKIIVK